MPRVDHLRVPVTPGALHAERYGFGDRALVLLHGFGTSSFLWRRVAPALPLGRVTAWALDLLGHGESDRPAEAAYGVAAQAQCVEQAMTALRIGQATLVGVDLGAAVALRLAATRPARIHGLVLIGPPPVGRARGADLTELGRAAASHLFEATQGMLGAAAWLAPLLSRSVATAEAMPARLVARYAAPFVGAAGVQHLQGLAAAVNDADAEDLDLARLSARTLVLRGEHDAWCSSADASRLAAAIRDADVREVPGAGRLVPEEAPETLAALLADWAVPVHGASAGRIG
ncbi:MAG: alpha/beta hydrolase [Gemmatimonadetes bacterium]|nr:alpha/beta hydrolase [Gemmatimonadota bacterium]